jgi:general secretion pathway protein H
MRGDQQNGFSLLEMIVALVIAALVFALVMPTDSRRRTRVELASSAHEVAAALRLSRSRAIATNRSTAVVVDVENDLYRLPGASAPRAFPRGSRITLHTTQDQELSEVTGAIRFYPDGSSTGGGVGISLGDDQYEVLVDWLTGRVSIHEQSDAQRR